MKKSTAIENACEGNQERDVRVAFDIADVTPEQRAENFAEASRLVKAYEKKLSQSIQLSPKEFICTSD